MKNFKFGATVFSLALCVCSLPGFTQRQFSDGSLVYNISIESTKGEKDVPGSLNGAVLTVFLAKDKSRTEMKSLPGTEATIYDEKAGKGYILKEYSGQKLLISLTAQNWREKNKNNSVQDFKTEGSSAVINGYTVKKATAVDADGKTYTVYYDPTVTLANKTYNNAFPQISGLPVQYELQYGNLIFRYTLVKYNAEIVNAAMFEAPKAGFRVMTYEENRQLKKGE